jgi:TonB family protein
MKASAITLFLLAIITTSFAQATKYELPGRLNPVIKSDKLDAMQYGSELLPDLWARLVLPPMDQSTIHQLLDQQQMFAVSSLLSNQQPKHYTRENFNKILDIVSVEIITSNSGKVLSTVSQSDLFTPDQKNKMKTADLGTDLKVKISFKYRNEPTDKFGIGNKMIQCEGLITIVPATEAEFPGGTNQIAEYFNENVLNKVSESVIAQKIPQAVLKFTVNEDGQIINASISRSSNDAALDKLLLEAVNKMPQWKPATNAQGIRVRQEFSLPFGNVGC